MPSITQPLTHEIREAFLDDHKQEFAEAAEQTDLRRRQFPYSAERFDSWAVRHGWMTKEARFAETDVERSGLVQMRHGLRVRLNYNAMRGNFPDRPFIIDARGQRWSVQLLERKVQAVPNTVAVELGRSVERIGDDLTRAQALLPTLLENRQIDDQQHLLLYNDLRSMQLTLLGFELQAQNLLRIISGRGPFDYGKERLRLRNAMRDEPDEPEDPFETL